MLSGSSVLGQMWAILRRRALQVSHRIHASRHFRGGSTRGKKASRVPIGLIFRKDARRDFHKAESERGCTPPPLCREQHGPHTATPAPAACCTVSPKHISSRGSCTIRWAHRGESDAIPLNMKKYLRVRHGGGRARKCYRMSFETPFSAASHLRKGSERLSGLSGRHSPQFFPAFGLPPPCDQKIRFRPWAGRNRIRVACGAGRELPIGVRPGPDHRTRTVHTGMPARWGAPVVHAHAASRARETRVWVRWPHHAAWGGLMGAPMSPDGRRVLPWPAMPARWCTRVHAPWRGGERRRGTEASGAGVPAS